MEHNYVGSFKRINLRPLKEGNIEDLRVLRNKMAGCFNSTTYITARAQKEWYKEYLKRKDDIMFVAELVDKPGIFIGAVALYDIDWINKTCISGRIIVDKNKAPERGIGAEIEFTHLLICFKDMKMQKVACSVHKDNETALKMDRCVGYRITGETDKEYLMEITEEDVMAAIDRYEQPNNKD